MREVKFIALKPVDPERNPVAQDGFKYAVINSVGTIYAIFVDSLHATQFASLMRQIGYTDASVREIAK